MRVRLGVRVGVRAGAGAGVRVRVELELELGSWSHPQPSTNMLHSEKARMIGSRMSTMKRSSVGSRALLWMFFNAFSVHR